MAFFEFPHTRTYDSDLGWLIKETGKLSDAYDTLMDCCSDITSRVQALEVFKDALESGDLPDSVQEAIYTWLHENALDIIGDLATTVFFEITDAGYWVAYIPDGWHEIIFNTTGLDIFITGIEYGHLVLSY